MFMHYRDTEEGVFDLLGDESAYDLKGATARPDPLVKGCWLVTLADGTQALVYTSAYQLGSPGFEECEPDT
jgi:hypothetical protein